MRSFLLGTAFGIALMDRATPMVGQFLSWAAVFCFIGVAIAVAFEFGPN